MGRHLQTSQGSVGEQVTPAGIQEGGSLPPSLDTVLDDRKGRGYGALHISEVELVSHTEDPGCSFAIKWMQAHEANFQEH